MTPDFRFRLTHVGSIQTIAADEHCHCHNYQDALNQQQVYWYN